MTESNTINPMTLDSPSRVIDMLQETVGIYLTEGHRERAENIIDFLGDDVTIASFVDAAKDTQGLRQFAIKVGAFFLPGKGMRRSTVASTVRLKCR